MSSFPRSSIVWLAIFLMAGTQSALPQQCPPNSHPAAVAIPGNLRTAQCFCDAGYENVAGVCVPIAAKPTIRRARPTRADCVGVARRQLKTDLARCRTPMIECLNNAGVGPAEAVCAASALVFASNPSKFTVTRAAIACGDKSYDRADVCGSTWTQCRSNPLKTYRQAIAACPNATVGGNR